MKIQNYDYLGQPMDVKRQFNQLGSIHFNVDKLAEFDPETKTGTLVYNRFERKGRVGFNMYSTPFEPTKSMDKGKDGESG